MPKYYSLETNKNAADLYIFGDITSWPWSEKDRDAYGIVKELQNLKVEEINVHINSYGGEVAEGLAIYNTLKNSSFKVTTYCDGFACSAASIIFMAGDERVMNSASLLMIHNAWAYAAGNANDFRKQADDLDKITQGSIKAYMSRVSISEEVVKQLLDEETWLTAEESKEYGFATKVLEIDDSGINQSAMNIIRDKILSMKKKATPKGITEQDFMNTDEIAERIFEKISLLLNQEQNKQQEDTNWGAFFM